MTTDLEADHHPADFLTATNHAFGPPSLNDMSFGSGRTSYRDGSSSLKQSRNIRLLFLWIVTNPTTDQVVEPSTLCRFP